MGYGIRDGDANGRHNWSMEQYSRTLGEGLFLLYGSNFFPILQFCKILVLYHGEQFLFIEIR